jgi:RecB family exonuclease
VITPRTIRLVRAPSLHVFQHAIAETALAGDLERVRTTAVIVPTRAAAAELRRTLEDARLQADGVCVLPDIVTRGDWYDRIRTALPETPRVLTEHEREAVLLAGSHEAITDGAVPPFDLRAGLLQEMLALYDGLHRHGRNVDAFERLLLDELEPRAPFDRGAERVLRQTHFLVAAFRSYERRVARAGAVDEHGLRARLLSAATPLRYRRIVVTVGDRGGEPGGLWPADFDLLARLHGLEHVDLLATEEQLAAGLHRRLQAWVPELEEVRLQSTEAPLDGRAILVPAGSDALYFSSRDREEEVRGVVRLVKWLRRSDPAHSARLDRTAVAFSRPLPYLYLARGQFDAARVPYQCQDALPLAAEPSAAAVDLVLDFVATGASRRGTMAVLRCAQLALAGGSPLARDAVHAFDTALAEIGYDGGPERLSAVTLDWPEGLRATADARTTSLRRRARPAARAAHDAIHRLAPLFRAHPASTQLDTLHAFLAHAWTRADAGPAPERHLRGRTAVLSTLRSLADAHRLHADPAWDIHDLAGAVRRWLEGQTFAPRSGATGVRFVDAAAARYGSYDDLHLVGLVDGEWPERERRNLFYAPSLLERLGWADDRQRAASARAAFRDLLRLASRRTSVSTFLLDNDAIVDPSPLLDDLARAGLTPCPGPAGTTRVFGDEALLVRPVPAGVIEGAAAHWLSLRMARSPADLPRFHGTALPFSRPVHSVGSVELYAHCPFKYFARYVLKLEEEVADEDGLSPRERGSFIHGVLEDCFARWDAGRRGTVTPATLAAARELFERVLDERLAQLAPSDARLERSRLLGSPVAPGLIDMVLRAEALRGTPVVERRLEDRFEGLFVMEGAEGSRLVPLRGTVDRIDLLGDGSLRVIDYKSSMPPRPLQLAIYAVTVLQRLRGHRGRDWTLADVEYIVFGGGRGVVPVGRGAEQRGHRLAEAQAAVLQAVDGIERGAFPPRPAQPHLCTSCAWAGVCRKDHVTEAGPAGTASAV